MFHLSQSNDNIAGILHINYVYSLCKKKLLIGQREPYIKFFHAVCVFYPEKIYVGLIIR